MGDPFDPPPPLGSSRVNKSIPLLQSNCQDNFNKIAVIKKIYSYVQFGSMKELSSQFAEKRPEKD